MTDSPDCSRPAVAGAKSGTMAEQGDADALQKKYSLRNDV